MKRALKFAKIDADAIPEIVFYNMRKLVITDFLKIKILKYMHIARVAQKYIWVQKSATSISISRLIQTERILYFYYMYCQKFKVFFNF